MALMAATCPSDSERSRRGEIKPKTDPKHRRLDDFSALISSKRVAATSNWRTTSGHDDKLNCRASQRFVLISRALSAANSTRN